MQYLIAVLLLFVASPAVPGPGGPPSGLPNEPAVVFHDGDADALQVLVHAGEVWHDTGDLVVGAFSPGLLDRMKERGLNSVVIDPALAQLDLYLLSDRGLATIGGRLPAYFTEIVHHGSTHLLAMSSARVAPGALPWEGVGHVGMSRVLRHPRLPGKAFTWRGHTRAGSALARSTPDPRVQTMVNQVDQNNLLTNVTALSSINTRYATTPGCVTARDMIQGWFQSFGLTTYLEDIGSSYAENVIAEIPGTLYPNEVVVIGGHYDSTSGSPTTNAPGADDNASGTAGVVEAARIFALHGPYERTVRFIAFGGEELGLIGSNVNAQASVDAGEEIVAMLNTDMNAYRAAGDAMSCDFITDNSSLELINFCQAAGSLYVPGWATNAGSLSAGTSDHAPYTNRGFPAVFYFEDLNQYSPYIHSTGDTVPQSANDFGLAQMIVQGVVAAAATKAEFLGLQIVHTPLTATPDASHLYPVVANVTSLVGSNVTNVQVHYSTDGVTYTSAPMTDIGADFYLGHIPPQGTPVTIHYYITADDDQGNTEVVPTGAELGGPAFTFFVGIESVLYATGFEGPGDEGWTHNQVAAPDDWQRGNPFGKADDPSAPYAGSNCWANDLGASGWDGEYEAGCHNRLKSPDIDCSGATSVLLEFQRWLTVEKSQWDAAYILVNGVEVWRNAYDQDHLDTSWTPVSIDITNEAAGNAAVSVEFRLQADNYVEFGGWNLDDFALVERGSSAGTMTIYGSGVNPPGSIEILGGSATLGDTAVVGVHNPLGTQGVGSQALFFVSVAPDYAYPMGTEIGGFGMSGPGGIGEILINILPPDPLLILYGGAWNGTPTSISVDIPTDPSLAGFAAFGQGAIFDPAITYGVKIGVTDAVLFQLGA